MERDGRVEVAEGAELVGEGIGRGLGVDVEADDVDVLGAGEPLGVDCGDGVRGDGLVGGPVHFDFGAVDGGGDGLPEGFEFGGGAVVFVDGVGVEGVGVDVPVYFVAEAEPDDGGALGEDLVQGGGDLAGGDLGEGQPGLEGEDVGGAGGGGGARLGGGLAGAVVARGDDLGVVAVRAGFGVGLDFGLDHGDVHPVREPAHGDAVRLEAVGWHADGPEVASASACCRVLAFYRCERVAAAALDGDWTSSGRAARSPSSDNCTGCTPADNRARRPGDRARCTASANVDAGGRRFMMRMSVPITATAPAALRVRCSTDSTHQGQKKADAGGHHSCNVYHRFSSVQFS